MDYFETHLLPWLALGMSLIALALEIAWRIHKRRSP